MRRLTVLVVLAGGLLLAAPAAAYNPQIAGLQVALRAHGLYQGPVDGIQGPGTRKAVRAFQRRSKLEVDGLAGPATRAALGRLGRPLYGRRVLRPGMSGWDVSVLQFLLQRHGFVPGEVDGHFGSATEKAVRRYQQFARLRRDGVVGKRTASALCAVRACAFAKFSGARRAKTPSTRAHRVKPGETLTGIAARYGTTIGAITRANRLDPERFLLAGARLRIPVARALATRASGPVAIRQPAHVSRAIRQWSRHYGVDVRLVRAIGWMESGYNNRLTSSYGAVGIMQVTAETWTYVETFLIGRTVPHDASGNVRVGTAYLAQLLKEFRGSERLALAAYAQGPYSVRKRGLLKETKQYVANVLALKQRVYVTG
ncbi:MAG: peptidoglycan-binding protein [Actinomycetota bacterium]|nr:peptidoglycan-binding protein [Actinomycetota bacterium]